MNDVKDYFNYLKNVVGVDTILLEQEMSANTTVSSPPQKRATTLVLFCVEHLISYTAEEKDLLGKMMASIKFESKDFRLIDVKNLNEYEARFYIFLMDNPDGFELKVSPSIKTYSPKVLLRVAHFKKLAWDELQKVIQYFKQSTK